jgi:hypothetical protein|nr:MAG TPA: hypothetical protein [Bacteriophage sp.]
MELTKEEQELILKMRGEKSVEKEFDIALTAYKNGIKNLIEVIDKLNEYSSQATENIKKRLKEDEFFNIWDFIGLNIALDEYREYFNKDNKGENK